mmetsp:Transcript_27924/g.67670  ORF Transcript_27924/g.67670 Transcript_27924/m.67670 type:complete len:1925 (+) Transcript_27924:271-6045(+)
MMQSPGRRQKNKHGGESSFRNRRYHKGKRGGGGSGSSGSTGDADDDEDDDHVEIEDIGPVESPARAFLKHPPHGSGGFIDTFADNNNRAESGLFVGEGSLENENENENQFILASTNNARGYQSDQEFEQQHPNQVESTPFPSSTSQRSPQEADPYDFENLSSRSSKIQANLEQYQPKESYLENHFNTLHVALSENAKIEDVRHILQSDPKEAEEVNIDGNCPLIIGLLSGADQECLELVLDISSSSVSIVNGNNECGLHYAVRELHRLTPSFITRILQLFPEAASMQTMNEDEMALHRIVSLPKQGNDSLDEGQIQLVEDLINTYPNATRVRDQYGRTPLHVAINNGAPVDVVLSVFIAFPEAYGIKDAHGRRPPDEAKYGNIPQEILLFMRDEYKEACSRRGVQVGEVLTQYKPDGIHATMMWNALHLAMARGASLDKVEVLLHSSPNMARRQNDAGNLPLLEGLSGLAGGKITMRVLEAYPDACRTPNKRGEYAIHLAASSCPAVIIEAILQVYPESINHQTRYGATPFHMLIGRAGSPPDMASISVLKCTSALKTADDDGDTPLSIAIKRKLQKSEIAELLDSYEGAAAIPDKEARYPLHSAIEKEIHEDTLISLLRAFPKAARIPVGPDALLPLHLAMKYRSGGRFTSILMNTEPAATKIKTRSGSTALSLALSYGADFESVHSLVAVFPDAAREKDEVGMVPLHIAMMKGADAEIVRLVYSLHPDAINIFNAEGHTPFHSGIIPAMNVLKERYPEDFRYTEARGGLSHRRSLSQNEVGRGYTPLLDLLSILENLMVILEEYPGAAQQRDKSGYLPLLHFCRTYNPSTMTFSNDAHEKATRVITTTFERLYREFTPAAEIVAAFVGTPVSVLVGECSVAKSINQLLNDEICKRLKIILATARDGRALEPLVSDVENRVRLWAFFALFDESDKIDTKDTKSTITINLNKEAIAGWTVLDMLADFDTEKSAGILLDIVEEQSTKMEERNQLFRIRDDELETVLEFISKEVVTETVKNRVADRAKLSNSSSPLRKWGEEYGRFLRRYRLEKQPKHVSETCVVVFGKESVRNDEGLMIEVDVALKFMTQRDTFLREVKKRQNTVKDYVVPILATYSEDLRTELAPYPNIVVNGRPPKYVIVMAAGAGYDLHDFISHQNVAGKDVATVTSIAKEIALCLKFLNETCGIIHGDVKARNFVGRGVGRVGQFSAIDLDNASTIRTEDAGRKRTSSGYMPPEQAYIEMYARSNDMKSSSHQPPAVVATPAYDMWCFGVLLYFLCTGKQLFNVDTKEDVDDDDLQRICTWDASWKEEKLSKVGSVWTEWIRLLDWLLQKDPSRRPSTWKEVIDEINTLGGQRKKKVYDRLVVFQAGPLVYHDKRTGEYPHCPQLDFQRETAMLQEALRDAEQLGRTIDVVLEPATLDRLGALTARKLGRVVHFSGHCNPKYMAWENDRGLLEKVDSEALKGFFPGGSNGPMLVFISACHSEWVGRQLVDQQVRHVVCCDVDERLLDTAAHEFTRTFYRALACGGTLLNAFRAAREAVRNTGDVANADSEARKFLLLPEKPTMEEYVAYHSQQVFFTEEVPRILRDAVAETAVVGLPRYRDVVWKRNTEQYSILENFMQYNADVVRVHGVDGCGKTAVVSALCERMLLRSRVHPLDYMYWFPSPSTSSTAGCLLYQQMEEIVTLMLSSDTHRDQLEALWSGVGKALADKKLLLVFDTRCDRGWKKESSRSAAVVDCLHRFVQEMLQLYNITSCKVILIERSDGAIPERSPWLEKIKFASVPVCPLEYDEAAELFALSVQTLNRHRFPILGDPDELVNLFYSSDDETSDVLYRRFLADGNPGRCRANAKQLGEKEINELSNWWCGESDNAIAVDGGSSDSKKAPQICGKPSTSVHMPVPASSPVVNKVELSVENWDDLIMDD